MAGDRHRGFESHALRSEVVVITEAWRRDRMGSALRGVNQTVVRWLSAGFAVIGEELSVLDV
jgi:hypothetical protein